MTLSAYVGKTMSFEWQTLEAFYTGRNGQMDGEEAEKIQGGQSFRCLKPTIKYPEK